MLLRSTAKITRKLSSLFSSTQATMEKSQQSSALHNLKFLNLAVSHLPVEENELNKPHKVKGHYYSKVKPQVRKNPRIGCLSESALQILDLSKHLVLETESESAKILAGNITPSNAIPVAHCYCGHQFGSWAGQLGDGRAITIGDIQNKNNDIVELQLKGSGLTPYSRTADGNAVLRSSVREFLCSEAMHALKIPTTRAASLIVSDDTAMRDPLYDHHVVDEPCAIVLRLANSFIRFGSFQVCDKGGPSEGLGEQMVPELLDFVIKHHYPHLNVQGGDASKKYLAFLEEITQRTARLVAHWQAVGFCHGVLNTDNMSIVGVTIDYGPFGFMEHFDRKHICNHSDKEGYYAYENQPKACKWNLLRLAESLAFAVNRDEAKRVVEEQFDATYSAHYLSLMREKLGILGEEQNDRLLIRRLFDFMDDAGSEFTLFFRKLAEFQVAGTAEQETKLVEELLSLSATREDILEKKRPMFNELKKLQAANPMVLAMRGISDEFLSEQEQKLEEFSEFEQVPEPERIASNANKLKNWMQSYRTRLSSGEGNIGRSDTQRRIAMNAVNPAVVLRNSMAQEAIELAEKGDFSGVEKCLTILSEPFKDLDESEKQVCSIKNKNSKKICVSCSS